jgi:hypothetical protein
VCEHQIPIGVVGHTWLDVMGRLAALTKACPVGFSLLIAPFSEFFLEILGTRTRAHSMVLYVSRTPEARPPNVFFTYVWTCTRACGMSVECVGSVRSNCTR